MQRCVDKEEEYIELNCVCVLLLYALCEFCAFCALCACVRALCASVCACVSVCVSVRVRMRIRMRACARACVRACVFSNANPLHYYVLRVPLKVDRWR